MEIGASTVSNTKRRSIEKFFLFSFTLPLLNHIPLPRHLTWFQQRSMSRLLPVPFMCRLVPFQIQKGDRSKSSPCSHSLCRDSIISHYQNTYSDSKNANQQTLKLLFLSCQWFSFSGHARFDLGYHTVWHVRTSMWNKTFFMKMMPMMLYVIIVRIRFSFK